MPVTDRDLDWPGCLNVRDLGGLATVDGRVTRRGAVVRSDNPAHLTEAGWVALRDHEVRTVIALRTEGTIDDEPEPSAVPEGVDIRRVFVEDLADATFVERCVVSGIWQSPLLIAEMLERWPDRCATGVRSVVQAPPGGVVISCGRGCDRTGVLAFLLLALAGVPAADIADDWSRSIDRLRPREPDFEAALDGLLDREGTTIGAAVEAALDRFEVADRIRAGGLTDVEINAARHRLVAP